MNAYITVRIASDRRGWNQTEESESASTRRIADLRTFYGKCAYQNVEQLTFQSVINIHTNNPPIPHINRKSMNWPKLAANQSDISYTGASELCPRMVGMTAFVVSYIFSILVSLRVPLVWQPGQNVCHYQRFPRGSGVPRGGSTPPPPKFRRPSKIVPNSIRLWKMLKMAEFRTPTPQDVRKKGSKILKLPPVRSWFTLAMTNKLVVIINSLKVPKIRKILLYEMKFLVPNYSCLQNPWLGGYHPQIPVLSVLNWICWTSLPPPPPPRTKFLGMPLPTGYQ